MNVDDDGDIDERLERFLLLDQKRLWILIYRSKHKFKTIPS